MAAAPRFKIYNAEKEYIACVKYLEDAAMFVALLGNGATIRDGHQEKHIIWREGSELQSASKSYDSATRVMNQRIDALWKPLHERQAENTAKFNAMVAEQNARAEANPILLETDKYGRNKIKE